VKKFETSQIRNIALFGHQGAGKTSLAEAMLFNTGVIDRHGSVNDGTTTTDFDPDEIRRQMSISSALAPCQWDKFKINVIDTPGFLDFVSELMGTIRVVEGAIMVVSAVSGVEVGLEKVWELADNSKLPRLVAINKMDKENANFSKVVAELQKMFGDRVVPIQLPIGSADTFKGIVDVLEAKAWRFEKGKAVATDIPAEMQDQVNQARQKLQEVAYEADDTYMEKFMEGVELTHQEFVRGVKLAVGQNHLVPVLCTAAPANVGVATLMDAVVNLVPTPADCPAIAGTAPDKSETSRPPDPGAPFSALVFKTSADPFVGRLTYMRVFSGTLKPDSVIYNPTRQKEEKIASLMSVCGKNSETIGEAPAGDIVVVTKLQSTMTGDTLSAKDKPILFPPIDFPDPILSLAIHPRSKGDEDKMGSGLSKICEEDPTLAVTRNTDTHETIISGMGDQHLEIVTERLKRKFSVDVELRTPKIPYRETVKGKAQVQGRHKKQSGGRGQFGDVWIELEPLPKGQHFEFVDKIVGGVIPRNYIPAVEKGIRKSMEDGVVYGHPITDIRVTLYDGSYHTVDSSDLAFQIAGSLALKKAMEEANPIMMEPVYNIEVVVPDSYMGDVIGDLNSKRGRIMGMDPIPGGRQSIKATVPLAEVQKYAIDLRSITQGRGSFKMSFSHYDEVPGQMVEAIMAAKKAAE